MRTRQQISYNMSQVRHTGSVIEHQLGKALWAVGLRYRKQYSRVPGRPDFAIVRAKIAVFADSSFWHGKNWPDAARDFKSNRRFWITKIEQNIARDRKVNGILRKLGWRVLRFWDDQIKKTPVKCAQRVLRITVERQEKAKKEHAHAGD